MAATIRVALIGLSSSAKSGTSWASGAHLPYLISERGRSKFQIVALLNSSVQAAKDAIAAYNLPPETRAYGDPSALAADSDVDLVVCNTRVDKHYETVYPSVAAGKGVYVEWPLASNAKQARELAELAKKSGSRAIIGVQGRVAPIALKIRELLDQGRIGKVLSSELRATGGTSDRERLPEGLAYFYKREVGGNLHTISFAHTFDLVQYVLGEAATVKGHFQLQRPEGKLFDPTTKEPLPSVQSDVPDLIIATASLPETPITAKNATVLVRFRRGQPFPGEPQLVWTINGEKGEIQIVSEGAVALSVLWNAKKPTIKVHDFESNQVEDIEWGWQDWQEELPMPARNIGAMYEAWLEGKNFPTFEDAAVRHEQLEEMIGDWKA
ncbi:hypothetical protein V8F20_007870 [Naviculisporaceae sp. PSN 640]